MSAEGLSRKMAGGAAWSLGARMAMRFSGLINVMILARLLAPADFGVVALTVAFVAAFEAMSDMSLNAALVRHSAPERSHYDTVWTLMILRGAAVGAVALMAAEALAGFYGDERLRVVACALAAQSVITGLTNPGVSDFQRDFAFHKDFLFLALRKLASTVACVACALTIWPDYRALLAGLIAGSAASVAGSYALSPYRPRLALSAFSELFGFSKWMMVSNLLTLFRKRADAFILARTLGMSGFGLYGVAMELANLVATEFAQPLLRATMPGFAKLQDDPRALRHQFFAAYGVAMAIAAPFAVGIGLVAEPAIRLAFGSDWAAAAAPMRILSFYGLLGASAAFCWPLIVAMGEPRRLAPAQIIAIACGAPAIWICSSEWGLVGAAWALVFMAGIYAVLSMRIALDLLDAGAEKALNWAPRVLGATLAMALAVRWAQSLAPSTETLSGAGANFLVSAVTGALVYPAALLALWALCGRPEGAESRLMKLARRKL